MTSSQPATSTCSSATVPMWWLIGLSVNRMVFSLSAQSATIERPLASSVLSLCITPLGVPVVPLVKAR